MTIPIPTYMYALHIFEKLISITNLVGNFKFYLVQIVHFIIIIFLFKRRLQKSAIFQLQSNLQILLDSNTQPQNRINKPLNI